MKRGKFAKYKGKEFRASNHWGVLTLFSEDITDVEKYGFEECEPFENYNLGRVVCKKKVPLSEIDEYYEIGLKAIYQGYKGGIGRPDKENNVTIGYLCSDITPDEAKSLGLKIGHGEYRKRVPMDELEIFEERYDYDIQKLIATYEGTPCPYEIKE